MSTISRFDLLNHPAIPTYRVPIELVVALLLGGALRLYRIGTESFWIDEVFTVRVATERSLRQLVFELPQTEPHPPLYNVFMWGWIRVVGTSPGAVRLSSALFAIATIPLVYVLVQRIFDRWTAGIVTICFALSPLQIWYAQEARMYGPLVFLTILSFIAFFRMAESYTHRRAAAYVLTATLLGYLHIFGFFVILAQAMAWFIRRRFTEPGVSHSGILGVYTVIGVLTAPWTGLLADRMLLRPSRYPPDPSGWLGPPGFTHLREAVSLFAFGSTRHSEPYQVLTHPSEALLVVVAVCFVYAIGYYQLRSLGAERWRLIVVGLWLLVPIVVPFVLSFLVRPMFELRYIVVSAPAFLILMGRGIRAIRYEHVRIVLVLLVITGLLIPLPSYYGEATKDDWETAAGIVSEQATEDDVVFVIPGWTWYGDSGAFAYYYDPGEVTVHPTYPNSSGEEYRNAALGHADIYLVISYTENPDQVITQVHDHTGADPVERYDLRNVVIVRLEQPIV